MILLTGATDYLGSQIARELSKRKMKFRVLVRAPSRLPLDPSAAGSEVARGDLCVPESLQTALIGVKYVVHTAALVKKWVRNPREFARVNYERTKSQALGLLRIQLCDLGRGNCSWE